MRVLVFITGLSGVSLHRQILPYQKVSELSNGKIDVQFLPLTKEVTIEALVEICRQFNVFVFSRTMPVGWLQAIKTTGIKIVNDTDDYWVLDKQHPLYQNYKIGDMTNRLEYHLREADYVTTTTQLLADKIKPLNPNVFIFPNALVPEGQFASTERIKDGRMRFGIIGSSSHTYDMELLKDINSYIPNSYKEKMQWVLCGFDKGMTNFYDANNQFIKQEQTPWNQVCWQFWEDNLLKNNEAITPEHKEWLAQHYTDVNDPYSKECYRRMWTKPVDNYATHYDDIDVLITPLQDSNFNKYKSNLKMVEAGIKKRGLIISNVEPYTSHLNSIIKNGEVDLEGNCIAVKNKTLNFAKAIMRCIDNPLIVDMMSVNLHKYIMDNFNLDKITERRIEWLLNL